MRDRLSIRVDFLIADYFGISLFIQNQRSGDSSDLICDFFCFHIDQASVVSFPVIKAIQDHGVLAGGYVRINRPGDIAFSHHQNKIGLVLKIPCFVAIHSLFMDRLNLQEISLGKLGNAADSGDNGVGDFLFSGSHIDQKGIVYFVIRQIFHRYFHYGVTIFGFVKKGGVAGAVWQNNIKFWFTHFRDPVIGDSLDLKHQTFFVDEAGLHFGDHFIGHISAIVDIDPKGLKYFVQIFRIV